MDKHYVLRVPVKPKAMPRPRAKPGQKAYYPQAYQEWRERAGLHLRSVWNRAKGRTVEGPVSVTIHLDTDEFTVWFGTVDVERVKGLRGDVDNYGKAVLDLMVDQGLIENDSQVTVLNVGFSDGDR